jgi:hypothetical protein
MAEGSAGAVHNRLIGCISAARRFMYLDVKIRLSNKFSVPPELAAFSELVPINALAGGVEQVF